MRHALALALPLAAATALLAGCATQATTPPDGSAAVQHPVECIDPSLVRGWVYVDDEQLLVDAGRRKYRVRLAERCFALGTSPGLVFKGDHVSNRVCGHAGEYVVFAHERCRIHRVERIDDETYGKLRDANRARGEVRAGQGD